MTKQAAGISPLNERRRRVIGSKFAALFGRGSRSLSASAARQMADLLERQSVMLAQSGMHRFAREACAEVRRLRLLAALSG